MSEPEHATRPQTPQPELEPPICEYCGMPITDDSQRCAALHDGRCRP